MKNLPLIHYCGAPGAGRSTSLNCVARGNGHFLMGDEDHLLQTSLGPVLVRFSSVATKFYYRATDYDRPDEIKPALRRMSEAAGLIFVADSQTVRSQHNTDALGLLRADLARHNVNVDDLPVVFQLNKRDLPSIMAVHEMRTQLATGKCDYVESVASKCVGAGEALSAILRMFGQPDPTREQQ